MTKDYVALGTFDGVHVGHRFLIGKLIQDASLDGARSIVCIFDPHPLSVISGKSAPKLLTSLKSRMEIISGLGAGEVRILDFNDTMVHVDGINFLRRLSEQFNLGGLYVGFNFTFGDRGAWNKSDIARYAQDNQLKYFIAKSQKINGRPVSSTLIRSFLDEGMVDKAFKYLGRPHMVEGIVAEGKRIGNSIGFPTANIPVDDRFAYPATGVYLTKVQYRGIWYDAMTNIGNNPTIADGNPRTVETHIIDMDKNIYGEYIKIAFFDRIRGEIKFKNVDMLRAQLSMDMVNARKMHDKIDIYK